jgi:hypothetical protein
VPAPPEARVAVTAWNLMRGLDWAALPVVCDIFGIRDPEILIAQLAAIRDAQDERNR